MDKTLSFERFIDNLELYLILRKGIKKKSKHLVEEGKTDEITEILDAQEDFLDIQRDILQKSFDEYISLFINKE